MSSEESLAAACAVQSEWICLQCVKKYETKAFAALGKVLRETFLPRLFFGESKNLPPSVGALSMFLVNKDIMGLHNPMKS